MTALPTGASPVVELAKVSRVFAHGAVRAVDNVSLQVFPGEILSLLGPSGCGKTTTMRMIAGLDRPSAGDIRIKGRTVQGIPPHLRNVGLVFQSLAIFPHMTVRENVAFGLRMKRVARAAIAEQVDRMLSLVQLPPEEYAERYPNALSGGQLQRVALARTLVTEPAVVLFDEPMAALDRRLRDYMAIELRAIQKRLRFAAIYVTHDQETASAMSDRLAIMQAGRIIQVGSPPDVYQSPQTRFVADFLGDANFVIPEAVGETDGEYRSVKLFGVMLKVRDPDRDGGGDPIVMFRPEHVRIATRPSEGAAKGEIIATQFKGGAHRWQINLAGGQKLIAQSAHQLSELTPQDNTVWVTIGADQARLLRR